MIASLVFAGALALGDCSGASCAARPPSMTWHQFASDPGRSYLYRDGVPIAAYDHAADIYRSFDAATQTWSEPVTPPWGARAEPAHDSAERTEANFGVDVDRLVGARRERYRLNGSPVSREQAREALVGSSVPDDAGRLRLTLIGDAASTSRVATDLSTAPPLAPWKDRLVVQAYPREHWAVAKAGFFARGKPTIYLQTPAGKVLHRQDDYADGAEGLANALRRADPDYDPARDADLRRGLRFDLSRIPAPAWIAAALIGYLLLRRGG